MSEPCGAAHPEIAGVTCTKAEDRCFVKHSAMHFPDGVEAVPLTWDNPRQVPPRKSKKGRVEEMAGGADNPGTAGPPSQVLDDIKKKLRRNDDPPNSHIAIEQYEPHHGTAKGRVLAYLRKYQGHWVDAPELATADIGGFAGTRRLRELRDAGFPIETRLKPGTTSTWQHRLLAED